MTKQPTLLLDMDGPLADFDEHFWRRCIDAGYTFDVDGPTQQQHRYFTDHMPDPTERATARAMVDTAGWFAELPVTPGAIEGVELLHEHFDVWVCTKPLETNPTCLNDKQAWLHRHFPTLENRMVTAPNKALIVGDILLDDAPNPDWFPHATWTPVIFATPYNQAAPWANLPRTTWSSPTFLDHLQALAPVPL